MFHIVLSIASRFLFLGNMLQGLARGILTLRHLGVISHLVPTLPSPPPTLLLDAAIPFVALSEETISPYPSAGLIAVERIERLSPAFSSPIPSYQSSLVTVTPSQLPKFLPLLIIFAMISGLVILVPEILYLFMNVSKITSAFTYASRSTSNLFRFRCISGFLAVTLPSHLTSSRLFFSLVSLLFLWTGPVRTSPSASFATILTIFSAYHCVLPHLYLDHVHSSLSGPRLVCGMSASGVYLANEFLTLAI